jgi:Domain of unknown function (DUF5668)
VNQWLQLRRLRGPAFLVLLGIMFLLAEWHIISFHRSWPLLLILAGILTLAERAALARVDPGQFGGTAGTYAPYPPPAYTPPTGSVAPPPSPSTELATTEPAHIVPGSTVSDPSEQGRF